MQTIAIIGGGASGLVLASELSKNNNYKIYLIDKLDHVGKKLLVTGNGKCNLSNLNMDTSFYNHDISGLLNEFSPSFIENFFNDLGIKIVYDSDGRMYPYSRTATSVLNALSASLGDNVTVLTNSLVSDIKKVGNKFIVRYNYSEISVDKVVLACGGKALNGTEFYKIVSDFGLSIVKDGPALCAIRTIEQTKSMSGLRINATVRLNEFKEYGEILFKDDGLSGIVIFNASRFAKKGDIIHIDLVGEMKLSSFREIELNLPKMVAKDVIDRSKGDLNRALSILKDYTFKVKERYPYKFCQIMQGGIDYTEVNPITFEANKVKGLYVLGEALDVDGACGGYNLHFAFASALSLARNLK